MKEIERKLNNLTKGYQPPYSKDGDIFMAEPGQGEQPMGVDEATRRLEEAARQGQRMRAEIPQTAAGTTGAGQEPPGDRPPAPPPVPPEEGPQLPGEGGGEQEPPFTDPILINIIEGIGRMDENSPVYSEFLLNQIKRIEALQDAGRVNSQEASRLQDSLYARLGEIQSQAQASRERAGGEAQREEEDPRTETENRARQIYDDLVNEQLAFTTEVEAGITDETLRRRIELDKQFFKGNPPDRVGELEKARRRIEGLTREPVEGETPDEKNEKDRIFLAEKNRVAERLEALAGRVKNAIAILGGKETRESAEGVFGDRKLSYEEKERIRNAKTVSAIEDLFNRVFDRVDRRPNAEFNSIFGTVGAYEYDEFMRVMNSEITKQAKLGNLNRVTELEKIVAGLSNERAAREIIHNSYFAVITAQNTEAVSNFMASFLTGYADLAFDKAGVVQAMHFYEQALLMVREKNGGYIPAKEVVGDVKNNEGGEVNIITEDLLRKANANGQITDRGGNLKQLEEWELKRALSFARGMSVVTGRSIEIAATSILPGLESGSSIYIDLFAQKIIQEIYPFRHADKFITRGKVSRALAYILNRPRKPWTPKELEDFAAMDLTEQVKVINDLMPEGKERFYSVLNPFEIGSWLSRSGWRIGGDPRNPGETAIKKMMMDPQERDWIGTGVRIEKERGNLEKLESKKDSDKRVGAISLGKIENALDQTARVTPLRFFLNIREFKERVLQDLLATDSVSSSVEKKKPNDYYFSTDEKTAINAEIDRRISEKEATRKEEDDKDAKLLERQKDFKPKELSKKEKDEEKDIKEEQRDKITFEVIMTNTRFKKDIEELILLQEKALSTKDETLIVGGFKEGKVVEAQSKLGKIFHDTFLNGEAIINGKPVKKGIRETYKQMFVRRLKDKGWKTPFIFGTEDVPFEKYVFEATGARSGSRRWADMAAAAKAGQAFGELLNGLEAFTEQGQIVEAMYKIHHNIRDYNEESAQRFSQSLSEGIMKFYAKTWTHRLPLGIGTANSMIEGNSSFAQIAFGRDKMAWDETKLNEFTRLVRNRGMNTVEQQHKLQERAGGDKKGVIWDSARTMLPLIMIALAIYMMSQTAKKES